MTQTLRTAESQEASQFLAPTPAPQPRRRYLATVTLRLLVMTGLASFWFVAAAGLMGYFY